MTDDLPALWEDADMTGGATDVVLDEAPALPEPSLWSILILRGLQKKPQYEGTVPKHVKARRRAQGRVAKQSRKKNRGNR